MGYRILLDSKFGIEEVYKRTKNDDYIQGDWIICKNIADFSKVIAINQHENDSMPELISFEFNLGFDVLDKNINPRAETGADAIDWLIDFCKKRNEKLPDWLTHSENFDHNRNMNVILENSKEIYGL